MKKFLLLLIALLFGLKASPLYALIIEPTWDPSITTNSEASAITNGILFAIQTLENDIDDNLTVKIDFVNNSNVDLGENSTYYLPVTYSSYLADLRSSATSVDDSNALSRLPVSSTDPVIGGSQIDLQLPLARLFGFYSSYGPDGYDSTIYLNIPIMNLSRPGANPNNYDLVSVTEHEMDEVLGFISTLPGNYPGGPIGPMDLFRYTTNVVRTWTTNGDNAYFSVDGTNLLARFNQQLGGDFHDWWSYTNLWAPPGVTPYPQVQDAYAYPDTSPDLGSNELSGLDVIGYTLASSVPKIRIQASGKNLFTISWLATSSGYVLQQSTNLSRNVWTDSATGSTNWVTLTFTNTDEFFRLAKVSAPPAGMPAASPDNLVLQQVTHAYRRHRQ
ncbi:MAG TPA: NF038122 family metalloprotease [Candidatus Sulfotelmatobacter sp.]|nr:NF038122 family metalloprotease [Candidatus Sulfotelmatobacter sp.]